MRAINLAVGCFFIAITAFLYASKFITAAIMTGYMNNPDVNYFGGGYDSIGFGLTFWIVVSFLIGVGFFISGVWPTLRSLLKKPNEGPKSLSE